MSGRLVITRVRNPLVRRNQRWRWALHSAGDIVATSGEGYSDRAEAIRMGKQVLSGAYGDALVVDAG